MTDNYNPFPHETGLNHPVFTRIADWEFNAAIDADVRYGPNATKPDKNMVSLLKRSHAKDALEMNIAARTMLATERMAAAHEESNRIIRERDKL